MLLRRPEFLILLLSISALFLSIKLIDKFREHGLPRGKFRVFEKNRLVYLRDSNCKRDPVLNIVMRFGFMRGLDFAFPGWSTGKQHISIEDKYNGKTRDLTEDNIWIALLSSPKAETPPKENRSNFRLFPGDASLNPIAERFGYDFPTYDLGYLKKFLSRVDDAFDLVLISEHLEASLVLWARLMDWPLETAAFLQNELELENRLITGHDGQKWPVHNIDSEIYAFFLSKFRQLVVNYGQRRMILDVNTLMTINARFAQTCAAVSKCQRALKSDSELQCALAETDESLFTELIRREQIKRSGVIKSLKELLGSE